MATSGPKISRYFIAAPVCITIITATLSGSTVAARDDWFRPNAQFQIIPPMNGASYAGSRATKNASFVLSQCNYIRSTYPLFQKPLRLNEVNRTVTVTIPKSTNISDTANINSIVVAAWYYAWQNCFAWVNADKQILGDFSGVRVIVIQQKKKIMVVGRTTVSSSGAIASSGFFHALFEQQRLKEEAAQQALQAASEAERQRQALQAEAERARFWANMKLFFWVMFGAIALGITARHIPKALAYMRYAFSPHPANRIVARATQRENSVPLNGHELASALRNVPKYSTGKILATRDINALVIRTNDETAYLRAAEKLARNTLEMEEARARNDEFTKHQEKS